MITSKVSAILAALALATISFSANAETKVVKDVMEAGGIYSKTLSCAAHTQCSVTFEGPDALYCKGGSCTFGVNNTSKEAVSYSYTIVNRSSKDIVVKVTIEKSDNRSQEDLLDDLLEEAKRG